MCGPGARGDAQGVITTTAHPGRGEPEMTRNTITRITSVGIITGFASLAFAVPAEARDIPDGGGPTNTTVLFEDTVETGTPILAALGTMTQRRMRHLPVVERGEIRGIVSIGDLVKYRIERIEAEADALRTYIQSA